MDRLTITQHIQMIKINLKDGDSATATYRALRADYDLHTPTTTTTPAIGKIMKKFEETGILKCLSINLSLVPNVLISRRSQEL